MPHCFTLFGAEYFGGNIINKNMTRALIRIGNNEGYTYFYVCHDGYPEGLGTNILGYLKERFRPKKWKCKQMVKDFQNGKLKGFEDIRITESDDFSWISYVYVVDCVLCEVKCYYCYNINETWETLLKPENQERIPRPTYCVKYESKYYNGKTICQDLLETVGECQSELEQYITFHPEDIVEDKVSYDELKEWAIEAGKKCSEIREMIEDSMAC